MSIIDQLKKVKKEKGITYTFIADKIGTSYNLLYRFTLLKENIQHRDLKTNQLEKLKQYLNEMESEK